MDKSKNLYGHLFALTANVMWGLMSPIGKSALQEFSPISVTTFRMVGAAAAFWILSMFCKINGIMGVSAMVDIASRCLNQIIHRFFIHIRRAVPP